MKLTEMTTTSYTKALIYGQSGAGKTCLAARYAKFGPVEIWDFEGKVESILNFYKDQPELLANIDVYPFNTYSEKEKIPMWMARTREIDALMAAKKPLPFKTLILDSITAFTQSLMRDYVVRSLTGIKRPSEFNYAQSDYGYLKNQLISIFPNGILTLPCNVIVLGHLETEKDETTGAIIRKPMMPGKNAEEIPRWFNEVYVLKVDKDGNRLLQTNPDSNYSLVRTQRGLPKEIKSEQLFL